jgi:hypothetical protein
LRWNRHVRRLNKQWRWRVRAASDCRLGHAVHVEYGVLGAWRRSHPSGEPTQQSSA